MTVRPSHPQRLGYTRAAIAGLTPPLETPTESLQPRRIVVRRSGSHQPSSKPLCGDGRQYPTLHANSYRLAGRTQETGGSNVPQNDLACQWARLDGDSDTDQADITLFLRCLTGPDIPALSDCAG